MAVMSGIVLFTVIWSMVFMILLPVRVQTQGDLGQIVEGTHAGAPEHHYLKKKALWTTGISESPDSAGAPTRESPSTLRRRIS